jgi:hypothetical protein
MQHLRLEVKSRSIGHELLLKCIAKDRNGMVSSVHIAATTTATATATTATTTTTTTTATTTTTTTTTT